ncbi:MAG: hypothetical protein NC222_06440 [Staphylococcus sp.]|nr:hypothetical protein [Staphylococcus sp.]
MAGLGSLEWQEEQRRKDAMQQQQPQNNISSENEKNIEDIKDNTEIIRSVLSKLPEIISKGLESIKKEQEETKKKLDENKKNNNTNFEITSKGSLKALDKVSGTLNNLINGNLKGIASNFAKGAGAFSVAIQGVIKGLELANKITEKQATTNQQAMLLGANMSGAGFYNTNSYQRNLALMSGMFGQVSIDQKTQNRYAQELSQNYALNLVSNSELTQMSKAKSGMESVFGAFGVSSNDIDKLQFNLNKRYGIGNNQVGTFNEQMLMPAQQTSTLSMPKFIQNLNRMSDSSVKYNGQMEYSIGLLSKFGKEIDKGSVSIEGLTAVTRGIAFGSTQQNAGIGAYLMQTGNLPSESNKFAGDPLGLAGWVRNNAENPEVIRGIENAVRTEAKNKGVNSPEGMQEYFRMRFSSMGYNLDNELYKKLAAGESLTPDEIKKISQTDAQAERNFYDTAEKNYQLTSTLSTNVENIYKILSTSSILNPGKTLSAAAEIPYFLGDEIYKKAVESSKNEGKAKQAIYTTGGIAAKATNEALVNTILNTLLPGLGQAAQAVRLVKLVDSDLKVGVKSTGT